MNSTIMRKTIPNNCYNKQNTSTDAEVTMPMPMSRVYMQVHKKKYSSIDRCMVAVKFGVRLRKMNQEAKVCSVIIVMTNVSIW